MTLDPMQIVAALLLVNAITYWLFCHDKNAAKNTGWRVPEKTLFFMALVGGSPAALYAMKKLRHKTKKSSFKFTVYFITGVQLAFILFMALRDRLP